MGFVIHEIAAGGGRLALSPLPGRHGAYTADLRHLLDWSPDRVVSLTEAAEMADAGAGSLGRDLAAGGVTWHALPIPDYGTPDAEAVDKWTKIERDLSGTLAGGGRVLVHCMGGCGRSGMVVLRLMIAAGEPPETALVRLRTARPCALETAAQMRWATEGLITDLRRN